MPDAAGRFGIHDHDTAPGDPTIFPDCLPVYAPDGTRNPEPVVRGLIAVRMSVLVTVDAAAWRAEYATADTASEIREQVKGMSRDAVIAGFAHLIPSVLTVTD